MQFVATKFLARYPAVTGAVVVEASEDHLLDVGAPMAVVGEFLERIQTALAAWGFRPGSSQIDVFADELAKAGILEFFRLVDGKFEQGGFRVSDEGRLYMEFGRTERRFVWPNVCKLEALLAESSEPWMTKIRTRFAMFPVLLRQFGPAVSAKDVRCALCDAQVWNYARGDVAISVMRLSSGVFGKGGFSGGTSGGFVHRDCWLRQIGDLDALTAKD